MPLRSAGWRGGDRRTIGDMLTRRWTCWSITSFCTLSLFSGESGILRQLCYRHKLFTPHHGGQHPACFGYQCRSQPAGQTVNQRRPPAAAYFAAFQISERQRDQLLSLADELTKRIQTVEQWLQAQAKSDLRVRRMQTHLYFWSTQTWSSLRRKDAHRRCLRQPVAS